MDARPKTRQVDRERKPSTQVPRGAKQIVIPMTQQQYDDIWHDADRVRSFIEQCARSAPELFRRASTKAIACTALGVSLEAVRPETAENRLGQRCLLLAPPQLHLQLHEREPPMSWPTRCCWRRMVPFWLLTLGFGHNDMFWYRLIERLGRNSLVAEPPSTTRPSCPRIWRRTSITPTGPARRATSRQPSARAAFWASG